MSIRLAVVGVAIVLSTGCLSPPVPPPVPPPIPPDTLDESAADSLQAPSQRLSHAGVGATVSASSSHREYEGEGPVAALVDGDLATRWSSGFSEPQWVVVRMADAHALKAVRLHWENASAKAYTLSVSRDGETWREIEAVASAAPGPRVDTVELDDSEVLAVKLDLTARVHPEWGFSLYEIELVTK